MQQNVKDGDVLSTVHLHQHEDTSHGNGGLVIYYWCPVKISGIKK
jgi:hypothetical protein